MSAPSLTTRALHLASQVTWSAWLAIALALLFFAATFVGNVVAVRESGLRLTHEQIYAIVYTVAPIPRPPRPSEHTYKTTDANGKVSGGLQLPCWHDKHVSKAGENSRTPIDPADVVAGLEPAEVFMSVVVPAYNEEQRLAKMLDEACEFLEREYGTTTPSKGAKRRDASGAANGTQHKSGARTSWEILIVSDGSKDRTEEVALSYSKRYPGGKLRVITLEHNRGKGGAVTHGLRHVRGRHAVFADADGASHFPDAAALVAACEGEADGYGRCVAVGSRAHMVSSDAVVKRSSVRNFLMHGFHLLLWLMTPRATSQIKDTQCGFKMFSRGALPFIVPHMHSEGWIFDVEMLMLAESAGVPMVEVPITWREVQGSKLNVVWDSLGMAWGLAILRAAWALGVYRTR